MVMFNFSLLGLKYPFLENFGPKMQKCLIKKKTRCLNLFKYAEFDGTASLSCFGPEIYFLDKFRPRNPKWSIFLPLYVTFAK